MPDGSLSSPPAAYRGPDPRAYPPDARYPHAPQLTCRQVIRLRSQAAGRDLRCRVDPGRACAGCGKLICRYRCAV